MIKADWEWLPYKKVFVFLSLILLILTILFLLVKLGEVIGFFIVFLKTLLLPFFIAIIISYLLHPIVTMLHNKGIPRSLAVLIIYFIFFGSLAIISFNIFPLLVAQIKDLGEQLPDIIGKLDRWLDGIRHDHLNPLPDSFQEGIDNSLENLEKRISESFSNITTWISNTIEVIITIFLVPFVAFYILKDYQILEKTIITLVPKRKRKEMIRLARDIDDALGNYIRGQLIVCMIIGVLAYIGYLFVGLPYALLLALIVGITNIIPYLGPFIGATPAVLVALSVSWQLAIKIVIVNLIVQIIEGNVVSPQVVGRRLHIHPLFIILSLLIGGQLAGIAGLILAVPVFAIIKVIIQHIGIYYLNRK
ncbi:AI-2E family transporter [Vulcanibacillus modesticaldus]|uniref:AI-2E family transporter n=1 Tax=Vulcanibacillus modesticaldus TaxID=337097 RepID=UPI000B3109C5|nr:AI-2E family transporter [Vulcanibacillus modesticaldus]